jgi:hypothetical protein
MSNERVQRPNRDHPEHAAFENGAFISENAVRGALERGPRARGSDRTATPEQSKTRLPRAATSPGSARSREIWLQGAHPDGRLPRAMIR